MAERQPAASIQIPRQHVPRATRRRGSDFSPSTVGADTILSLLWGCDDYSSKGSLTLFLDGNTGTGTHSAVIQGVSVGSSGAGVYSASGGYTSYAWASPMPDPLGITNDVTIDCVIS